MAKHTLPVKHATTTLNHEKNRLFFKIFCDIAELLGYLNDIATRLNINARSKMWPKNPSVLSRKLNDIIPGLREVGIDIERRKDATTKARIIEIRKNPPPHGSEEQSDESNDASGNDKGELSGTPKITAYTDNKPDVAKEKGKMPSPSSPPSPAQDHVQHDDKNGGART